MPSSTRLNSGPSARKSGRNSNSRANGWLEKMRWPVAAELGDAGRKPVEHVALRADEAGEFGAGLLTVLDVDRIAGHPGLAERNLDHRHRAPLAGDRRGNGAGDRLAALAHGRGLAERRAALALVDEFDAGLDDAHRVARLDRGDIGAVDHRQAQVRPAMPDRERRRLDQRGQGLERGGQPGRFAAERGAALLGLGRVHEPEQGGPLRIGRGRRPAFDPKHPGRALRAHSERDRPARGRALPHGSAEPVEIGLGEPGVSVRKPAKRAWQVGQAEEAGQPLAGLHRAILVHQQRHRRPGREQSFKLVRAFGAGTALAGLPQAGNDGPCGQRQPGAAEQGDRGQQTGGHGNWRHSGKL
jgi:hypothetical protein